MTRRRTRLARALLALAAVVVPLVGAAPNASRPGVARWAAAQPELPRVRVATDYTPPTGKVIRLDADDNLQAAIDRAKGGDVIRLAPGATYTGNFLLRAKGNTADIVIETADSTVPVGTRVTPATAAGFAKIVTPNERPALATAKGAAHYRVQLVEISVAPTVPKVNSIVNLGDGSQKTPEEIASYLILDRVYVHGSPTLDSRRAVALNSAFSAVINSTLSDIHSVGQDAQALIGWNGPGPFRVANNYLEGSTENVMFGGANPSVPNLIPSDIEVVGNYMSKPVEWKGKWSVKNIFEVKFGQRILVEGNVLENVWMAAQTGFAFNLKTATSEQAPWAQAQDITVRYNIIRNAAAGMSLAGLPTGKGLPMQRVAIVHNLFTDIGSFNGTTNGRIFQISRMTDLTIAHNTIITNVPGTPVLLGGGNVNLDFNDNIFDRGAGGVKGSGAPEGAASFAKLAMPASFSGNVIAGANADRYQGNYTPNSLSAVGFADASHGDYRLAPNSRFARRASDGTDPGADVARVMDATKSAVSGAP